MIAFFVIEAIILEAPLGHVDVCHVGKRMLLVVVLEHSLLRFPAERIPPVPHAICVLAIAACTEDRREMRVCAFVDGLVVHQVRRIAVPADDFFVVWFFVHIVVFNGKRRTPCTRRCQG